MNTTLYNFNNMTVLADNDNVHWFNLALNEDERIDHPYALQLVLKEQIEIYHSLRS